MRVLLIDDWRTIGADETARTYDDGIAALQRERWDVLYLDHDLGCYKDGREWTGYDVLNWLEQNPQHLPGSIVIVSSNPSGRERMAALIGKLYANQTSEPS